MMFGNIRETFENAWHTFKRKAACPAGPLGFDRSVEESIAKMGRGDDSGLSSGGLVGQVLELQAN